MEVLILALFSLSLLLCLISGFSILYALLFGLLLFLFYGKKRGFAWRELLKTSLTGIWQVRNILITFLLIGILTALWRASGTIAVIVCYASRLIHPRLFVLMAFLLNCFISVLTGTAFGTAATMGVICMTIASSLGVSPLWVGGAVLAGAFFGDRCSPVSTSALLVAELTKTSIFSNIRNMLRSALVPFLLSCAVYALCGAFFAPSGKLPDLQSLFARQFVLRFPAVLPAIVLLLLSACQVNVKIAMSVCILSTLPICLFQQGISFSQLPALMFGGYHSSDPQLSSMLNGGGVVSMLKVSAIILLSSAYSGLFTKTGILERIRNLVHRLALRFTPFCAVFFTSLLTGVIACNQTLTIMLAHQLCHGEEISPDSMALHLEDTAVVLSPLIPWSIACAVPLSSIGAPSLCIFTACFLYLLPLWRLLMQSKKTFTRT